MLSRRASLRALLHAHGHKSTVAARYISINAASHLSACGWSLQPSFGFAHDLSIPGGATILIHPMEAELAAGLVSHFLQCLPLSAYLLHSHLPKEGKPSSATAGTGSSTPSLHTAARRGALAAVLAALEAGASLESRDTAGRTALHIAAQAGRALIVRVLLKRGADRDALTATGATPLFLAASHGKIVAVRELVAAGGDINALDAAGCHCLHAFMRLRKLIAAGADVALASKSFPTPIAICLKLDNPALLVFHPAETSTPELVRILATRGCSVVRLRVSKGISAGQSSTFLSWWMLCSQRGPVFSEHPGTVAMTEALLQSVAAETEGQLHPFARAAAATGSLRLWVDAWLALEAQKQGWTLCHAMIQGNLLRKAVTEFQWALSRRDPSLSTWDDLEAGHNAMLCSYLAFFEMLFDAGYPPFNGPVSDIDPFRGGAVRLKAYFFAGPDTIQPLQAGSEEVVIALPSCAADDLDCLPRVLCGLDWSIEVHWLYPIKFQRAARTLLLINELGRFPAGQQQQQQQGALEGQGGDGVRVPMSAFLQVLRLAARSLHAWMRR